MFLIKLFCLGQLWAGDLQAVRISFVRWFGSREWSMPWGKLFWMFFTLKVIKYWLLAHFPSFAGKKQEADELSGDASVEDDAFVKVKC